MCIYIIKHFTLTIIDISWMFVYPDWWATSPSIATYFCHILILIPLFLSEQYIHLFYKLFLDFGNQLQFEYGFQFLEKHVEHFCSFFEVIAVLKWCSAVGPYKSDFDDRSPPKTASTIFLSNMVSSCWYFMSWLLNFSIICWWKNPWKF
jgi:hypothetical protein